MDDVTFETVPGALSMTLQTVGDADVCPSCRERDGVAFNQVGTVDTTCTNPNGCRCVFVATTG